RLCQNHGGRDLEFLGQSPERPSSSERIVTPGSAIDAEQLAPLGPRQIEPAQGPPRRGVNLFNKLLVEEHPNHKLLKRWVTHCVFSKSRQATFRRLFCHRATEPQSRKRLSRQSLFLFSSVSPWLCGNFSCLKVCWPDLASIRPRLGRSNLAA